MSVRPEAEKQLSSAGSEISPPSGFLALLSGATIVLVGSVAGRFFEFVTRTALGRYLGPDNFGLLTSGIATLSILSTLVLLGLPSGLVRFVGQYKGQGQTQKIAPLVRATFWFVVTLSCLVGVAVWFTSDQAADRLLNDPRMSPVLHYVGLALPLVASLAIMSAIFQSEEDAGSYALLNNFLLPVGRLACAGLAVLLGWKLATILPVYLIGTLILPVFIALFLLQRRSYPILVVRNVAATDFKPLLHFSAPLLIGSLFGLMIWQVDLLVLQREWGAVETGQYAAALTIGRLPVMILVAFGFMLAPYVAQQYGSGQVEEMRRMYGRIVEVIFILGLPVAAFFILFAPLLLKVLFGAEYVEAAPVLRILAVGFFVHSITGPNGNTLVMMGRSRLFLVDTVVAAVITALCYVTLIPRWGSVGAAVGTLTGLLTMNTIFAVQLFRLTQINPLRWLRIALLIPITIAASLALLLTRGLHPSAPDWLILFFAASILLVTYGVFALLFRIVRLDEIIWLKQIILNDNEK